MAGRSNIQITRNLSMSFAILICIFCLFSIYTYYEIRTLSNLTRTIYNHPLVVSNAALYSNVSITKMHRNMKDVVLYEDTSTIEEVIRQVREEEQRVYRNLDVVKEKILGEQGQLLEQEARVLFTEWKPIREEVISHVAMGERRKAAGITVGKGAVHVALLEEKMLGLTNYARDKATKFMRESETTLARHKITLTIYMLAVFTICLVIALYTIKQTADSERALRESENFTRKILASSINGIYIYDLNINNNIYINSQYTDLTGYTKNDLDGMDVNEFLQLFHEEDQGAIQNHMSRVIGGDDGEIHEIEYRFKHKDGHWLWLFSKDAIFERNPDGTVHHFIGTFSDITYNKNIENQIRNSLREKETLLRELYHRTKNNMQVIVSMINLQTLSITDKAQLVVFRETIGRIKSMALVHEKLYQTKNLSEIELGDYFLELIQLIQNSYEKVSRKIELESDLEEVFVSIEAAIPCGLIMNELVTNVFKHAFGPGQSGVINLSLKKKQNHQIEFVVQDNGKGLPENFNYRTADSLGLRTIIALAEQQLSGFLTIETRDGTRACVGFTE